MKAIEFSDTENMELLMEIVNLKAKLRGMYNQTGPNSSIYITLSIKLNLLMNKYFEEKAGNIIRPEEMYELQCN
ncbi:hypothetical protein [Neobacillus drentensis]|uniref:hypothetical protein n=1 Tax=Neobacillus drentensis TaxID=220684 RepID=UPI002859A995|nr:hypothetical protein [Neobacillus drentensis]MDR7239544.1 hypothetical protein [Neobacillus drentensis]